MVTEEQIMAFLGQDKGDDLTPEELNQLSEEELVAYFIAQDEAKFNLGGKYDATASSPNESQNPTPALSIPLGGERSVNPTIDYQNGMVTPGVAAQGGENLSGYGNVEINKMGPQAVNAGISGDRFNVDANIPLSNPAGVNLRGEIDLLPPEKKEALALALELSPQDARYYLGLRYNY
jgi:hypothetical protein